MAMSTHSKFYYGYEINLSNYKIDFNEGAGNLVAELTLGIYSPTDLATEIKTALDAAGVKTYTVTFNRTTRKFTIAANTGTYSLLINSGDNAGLAPYSLLGFTIVSDLTGSITYTSNAVSGFEYRTQFKLQDVTLPNQWTEKVDASINESASGFIEIISFGDINFTEFNFMFVTDKDMDGKVIRNLSGVDDILDLLNFSIKRGVIDFMPDENSPATFYKIILESTDSSSKGIGFKLKEETGKNLPGFYQTGKSKWRVQT